MPPKAETDASMVLLSMLVLVFVAVAAAPIGAVIINADGHKRLESFMIESIDDNDIMMFLLLL